MPPDPHDDFRQATGFEWDEIKRRANIEKHGLDFVAAIEVFEDPRHYTYTSQVSSTERRYVSVGMVRGLLVAVVSTPRNNKLRIISARVARKSERGQYAD